MKTTTSPRRRPGASMRIAAWALSALLVWGQLPVAAVAQAAQQPAAFAPVLLARSRALILAAHLPEKVKAQARSYR